MITSSGRVARGVSEKIEKIFFPGVQRTAGVSRLIGFTSRLTPAVRQEIRKGGKNGRCGLAFVDERDYCADDAAVQERNKLKKTSQSALFLGLEKSHKAVFSLHDV